MRRFAAMFALTLACVALHAGFASADGVRTLVVRGLVARADGKAAVGARVSAKGPLTVAATVDDRGRYSLQMPIGSAAALRNGAFRVEVRAEHQGKKLAATSGQPALVIEVAFVPGTTRLRVRSNSPSATAAVITAFAQEGVPTAWVDADFGGALQSGGTITLGAEDEVALAGVAPAPGATVGGRERTKPEPTRTPAPIKLKPAESTPAPPVVTKPAPPKPAAPKPVPVPRTKPGAADSVAAARRTEKRDAARTAEAAKQAKRAKPTPVASRVTGPLMAGKPEWVTASPADSTSAPRPTGPPQPSAPIAKPVPAPGSTAGSRVVPIEAFSPPAGDAAPDTCACRLRGTVEVEWEERPLEKNVLVELTLEGPARQDAAVDLYMGPPREFRLGPLPCGEYRLVVRPRGKLRYSLVRGDSVIVLRCDGHTQQRVVLTPLGR